MLQRVFLVGARGAAPVLQRAVPCGLACGGRRWYSDEKMLEGTPRFTRMRRKWARKGPQELLEESARDPRPDTGFDESASDRKWGFSKETRSAAGRAALMSICSGITFVVLYHIGTYVYAMRLWPAPEELKGVKARLVFTMARYYEYMKPKPEKALALLGEVLDLAAAQDGGIDQGSLVVLDAKLRMAQCMYSLGRRADAEKTLDAVLPALHTLAQSPQPSYADDRDGHSGDWLSADMLL
ncbi:hypothetical protein IWQ56_005771, partial [Coemansia nantahalensis]